MLIIHSKFCWNFSVDSLWNCVLCWPELDGWPWWSLIRFSGDGGILQKTSWKDLDTKHFICPLLRLWLLVSIYFVVLLCPSSRRLLSTVQSRYPIDYIVIFPSSFYLDCFTSSNNIENWIEIHPSEQHRELEPPLSLVVFFSVSVSAKYHISHWQTASESLLCRWAGTKWRWCCYTWDEEKLEKSLVFREVDDSWTRPTGSWVFWCDQRSKSLRIAIFFFPIPKTAKEGKKSD